MNPDDKQIMVQNNEAKHRYEARVDGYLAVLTYEREGNSIVYLHTAVPSALAGRGVGSRLARTALEEARSQKHTVVPQCPFVALYIRRHPEYLALLAESEQARFQSS